MEVKSNYRKYLEGELINSIYTIGKEYDENTVDANRVIEILMGRVKRNIECIYRLLPEYNYVFTEMTTLNEPISERLNELNQKLDTFGKIPLSLIKFYEIIGEVNFEGYFRGNEGVVLDPLQVYNLKDTIAYVDYLVENDDKDRLWDKQNKSFYLPLINDKYSKANISNNEDLLGIQLTEKKNFDSQVAKFKKRLTFINYLRVGFQWGGFIELQYSKKELINIPDLKSYLNRVKKDLEKF